MIYMTSDEWYEISNIMLKQDFYKLAQEICIRTCNLNISQKELEARVKFSMPLKEVCDLLDVVEQDFNKMVEEDYKSKQKLLRRK